MGEVEHKVSSYLKKPKVLADFLNGILYDGNTVIWPEQLENVNRFYDEQLESRDGKRRKVDREREMLDLSGTDETLQSGLENYRLHVINLIDVKEEIVTVHAGTRIHCAYREKMTQVCPKPIAAGDFNGFGQ